MGRKSQLRGCRSKPGSRQQKPQHSIRVDSIVVNETKSTGLRNKLGVERGWVSMIRVVVRTYVLVLSPEKFMPNQPPVYTSFKIK